MITLVSTSAKRCKGGGLAWINSPKKDMVVTFCYSPLDY